MFKVNDKLFNAICWDSLVLGIFIIKKCVGLSLTSFGTLKYDYLTKIIEMFNFLPLKNNSVSIGLSFLLSIISAIISSKAINTLRFFSQIIFFNVFINVLPVV